MFEIAASAAAKRNSDVTAVLVDSLSTKRYLQRKVKPNIT